MSSFNVLVHVPSEQQGKQFLAITLHVLIALCIGERGREHSDISM